MNDFKWFAIMFCGLFAGMGVSFSVQSYSESLTNQKAMEQGYIQVVEDGHVVWKKDE